MLEHMISRCLVPNSHHEPWTGCSLSLLVENGIHCPPVEYHFPGTVWLCPLQARFNVPSTKSLRQGSHLPPFRLSCHSLSFTESFVYPAGSSEATTFRCHAPCDMALFTCVYCGGLGLAPQRCWGKYSLNECNTHCLFVKFQVDREVEGQRLGGRHRKLWAGVRQKLAAHLVALPIKWTESKHRILKTITVLTLGGALKFLWVRWPWQGSLLAAQ